MFCKTDALEKFSKCTGTLLNESFHRRYFYDKFAKVTFRLSVNEYVCIYSFFLNKNMKQQKQQKT